ncbi:ParB/RepB/Spo0J family partition protein [Oxalobacteraceae bacterium GrIS 1.11]
MRKPLKVSGLIAGGALTMAPGVGVSTAFDAPTSRPQTSTQPGVERMISLNLIDDSPYQFRRKYNPIHIDELSQSFLAIGQRNPITVREVVPGRYETIKGHCRRRAAKIIDWPEVKALVVVRNDREAKLDAMIDNEGEPLNEYEYARMFKDVLNDKFAKNQTEVAGMFVCSQAKVSNCLSMLELPEPVILLLDKDSALFGAKAAKVIMTLWHEHPDHHTIILEAIDRLNHGAEQGSIKGWVAQKLTQQHKTADSTQRHVIPSSAGVPRYITRSKARDIIVRLADPTIDMASVHKRIDMMLREMEREAAEKNIN